MARPRVPRTALTANEQIAIEVRASLADEPIRTVAPPVTSVWNRFQQHLAIAERIGRDPHVHQQRAAAIFAVQSVIDLLLESGVTAGEDLPDDHPLQQLVYALHDLDVGCPPPLLANGRSSTGGRPLAESSTRHLAVFAVEECMASGDTEDRAISRVVRAAEKSWASRGIKPRHSAGRNGNDPQKGMVRSWRIELQRGDALVNFQAAKEKIMGQLDAVLGSESTPAKRADALLTILKD